MAHKFKKHFSSKKRYLTALLVLLLLILMTTLELTNTTHLFHKNNAPATNNTKGNSSQNSNQQSTNTGSSNSTTSSTSNNTKSIDGVSGSVLLVPSGIFVSNHHPNLSGTPAPNLISSVCTTTPGANCTIEFTKSGVTKSLTAKVADASGSVYWDWKLQDIGLTSGSWQIQAVATLSGQTKTATDSLELVVSP